MTTEKITIERLRCDRCDTTQDCDANDPSERAAWGTISAQFKQGAVLMGDAHYSKDLCPQCCISLASWSRKPEPRPALREA